MTFLLDTNACIRLLNGTAPAVATRLARHVPTDIRISSVVQAELLYGARNSSRVNENLRLVSRFTSPFIVLPFDEACAHEYAQLRVHLNNAGTPIGPNDLLIAATALASGATLVTHNVREFARVPRLLFEDWESEE